MNRMRLTRVYVNSPLVLEQTLTLQAMSSAHLIKVLRLRAGAQFIAFNGDGRDFLCEIVIARAEACEARVLQAQASCPESPVRICLIQAICRGEKMDWLLEKATELGVSEVVIVKSERSEVHLEPERASKRREHWQRVAISACEQSGRAVVPEVRGLFALDQFLSQQSMDGSVAKVVLQPAGPALGSIKPSTGHIQIAVGPEGGWSERDLQQLSLAGFQRVGLGPRILRTETAGLVGISVLQHAFGDFR